MPLIPVNLFWGAGLVSWQWEQRNLLVGSRTSVLGSWCDPPRCGQVSKSHRGVWGSPVSPQYSLICPWNCLQQNPKVGADPTKQQIQMGTKDKHPPGAGRGWRAQCEPGCSLIALLLTQPWDLEFSVFPKQTQFQTEIIDFCPFPSPFSDKKNQDSGIFSSD